MGMALKGSDKQHSKDEIIDIFIIGGGVNGCGIARDMAGRGLSVVLAEMSDLAGATSSASTKLFHGGLRYLEYFEIKLVRNALKEREVLLRAMPHISWPMRFVLPYHKDMRFDGMTPASNLLNFFMPWMKGRRPAWLIRLGLFVYDHLGGRKLLPGTSTLDLKEDVVGLPLHEKFTKAYEYSDCWVQDSRLVVLNARDAKARGARIHTRTEVISARRVKGVWEIKTQVKASNKIDVVLAKTLINAAGPWVEDVVKNVTNMHSKEGVRLVRGSHIIVRKIFNHDKAYFFQGEDGRIVFAIPYEDDFTLIGTTDHDHKDGLDQVVCTDKEKSYLIDFISNYFKKMIKKKDIIWSYSGVRPLYDDGVRSVTAATRDYVLSLNEDDGAPLLNIFGGKITTYRLLAEKVFEKLHKFHPHASKDWTAGVALPGGDFPVNGVSTLIDRVKSDYKFLDEIWAKRMIRCYGTDVWTIFSKKKSIDDLGINFGNNLTEVEVVWLIENEFAFNAEDVVWRRTKLGLQMNKGQIKKLDTWMNDWHKLKV